MPNRMTSSSLLEGIKLRTFQPEDQTTLTDSEILNIAWEEMVGVIYPILVASGTQLFATKIVTSKNSRNRIRLPGDVLGARIYSLKRRSGSTDIQIPQCSPHDVPSAIQGPAFYFESGEIVLVNCENINDSFVVTYPVRPGRFQLPTDLVSHLACISGSVGYLEMPVAPTDIFNSIDSETGMTMRINFQLATSPFTYIPANMSWNTITGLVDMTSAGCPAERAEAFSDVQFAEGDVALAGDTVRFVPLPTECCDWLVQRAALRILEYTGRTASIQRLQDKLADIEVNMKALYQPRSSGNGKIIGQTSDILGVF